MANADSPRSRGRPLKLPATAPPELDRNRIVAAALAIVDAEGLEGLTMRRLGAELGVDPKAIYYYLPSKASLNDALLEALMSTIRLPDDFDLLPIRESLGRAAHAYKDALLAHPNALPTAVSRPLVTLASLDYIERVLARLLAAGFEPRRALDAVNLVGNFIRGSLQMWIPHAANAPDHVHDALDPSGLPADRFPALLRVIAETGTGYAPDRTFQFGLDLILDHLL